VKWRLPLPVGCGLGVLLLSGTTPGAVGSCNGDDELSRPAEFRSYCEQREQLVCIRRFLREEITAEARDICLWDALAACALRAFPAGCEPTLRETDACVRALSALDTVDTPDDQIGECQLCEGEAADGIADVAPQSGDVVVAGASSGGAGGATP